MMDAVSTQLLTGDISRCETQQTEIDFQHNQQIRQKKRKELSLQNMLDGTSQGTDVLSHFSTVSPETCVSNQRSLEVVNLWNPHINKPSSREYMDRGAPPHKAADLVRERHRHQQYYRKLSMLKEQLTQRLHMNADSDIEATLANTIDYLTKTAPMYRESMRPEIKIKGVDFMVPREG